MANEKIDCFLDTNVLIYAAQVKTRDEHRSTIARELALSRTFGVSGQTLAEFYTVTTYRARVALPASETDQWIRFLSSFPFTPVDQDIVERGVMLSRRHKIRYYDAALLAAAERLGAPIFYSEDLNNGQTYGSVRVVNPFA